MWFLDTAGTTRLALGTGADGLGGLTLSSKLGTARSGVIVTADGKGSLFIIDENGKVVFQAP